MKSNSQIIPKAFGDWFVLQKIGEGSFGSIYSAQNSRDKIEGQEIRPVAIKTELITNVKQMLLLQYQIYKQFDNVRGFPRIIQYVQEQRYSYLVMQKFQSSLDKYAASKFPKQFVPPDTLLQIMNQILNIIQKIHKKGYLYRDLKPSNFMVRNPFQQIFIIDFGLCKKYLVNNRHIPMKKNKKLVGTPLFCSLNTHAGLQQSRRDDIQSWILTCLYFSIELPWQWVTNKKETIKQTQYEQIQKIKRQTKWDALIKQQNKLRKKDQKIPICIGKILDYVLKMKFQEQPNYKYLQKLIKDQYQELIQSPMRDYQIDWLSKIRGNQQQNIQQSPQKVVKKEQLQSAKKVRKINFKAPLKSKTINTQNQAMKKFQQPQKEKNLNSFSI